jgi:DNA polymerase elongation subunit (family B)
VRPVIASRPVTLGLIKCPADTVVFIVMQIQRPEKMKALIDLCGEAITMTLKDCTSIKKPLPKTTLDVKKDIILQVIDFYRCVDPRGYRDSNGDSDEEEDEDCVEDLYSKEKQKEMSRTQPMLIKIYGVLESGHSITVNLTGFEPFYYIKIPEDWKQQQCDVLMYYLRSHVLYRYKEQVVKTRIVTGKPFSQFTGDDTFKYLRLQFKNKETFDSYQYQLMNPLTISGLNGGKPHKYDLYESNIEPILKFIHLTKINPSGWIRLPTGKYSFDNRRTTSTGVEVTIKWDQIVPHERLENASINMMAFDIEANSSHGDFPIGVKDYQKLAQELVTLYNDKALTLKKPRMTAHPLLEKNSKRVIQHLLNLIFDDNYTHLNNNIHQIHTIDNLKPLPETLTQIAYAIVRLYEDQLKQNRKDTHKRSLVTMQITDLLEYNLPAMDLQCRHNSDYQLLAREIVACLNLLSKNNNRRYQKHPTEMVEMMLKLAFDDYFDGFLVSNIYTKENIKPSPNVLESLVSSVHSILMDCVNYVHKKKIPERLTEKEKDEISQDYFVQALTHLFNDHLPPIEGDNLIQMGSTFQLTDQPDCYLKHIICLGSCDSISNSEMIELENKDIYLPVDELAHDLVMYDLQAQAQAQKPDQEVIEGMIKKKAEEIKKWTVNERKQQCKKATEYRRFKQTSTDHSKVVVEFYDNERDILLAWKELVLKNDPDMVIGYNIFGFDFKFMYDRAKELGCEKEFCQLGRLNGYFEDYYEQKLSSAGLGDNTLKYIPMSGRVILDLYKVIQRDYKLESYKLTNVAHKFLYKEKVDLSPKKIFTLQKGTSLDRKTIATYCLVDCILCNRLVLKLEIITNNIAQAGVYKVPFPYLFLRGQGIKILSLVSDYCANHGYYVPVLPKTDPDNNDKYEGAIVLTPDKGIHLDPVAVGDFNSLYPSSMISENISHDSYVEIGGKYDNLPNYTYNNIEYDIYKTELKPGTKKKIKRKVGVQTCRYAQLPDNKKSVLPSILMNLLSARKNAKNKMEEEKDPFKAKIWNCLQLAYKVTANSLYGQCGAKTSPISKVEIAASTTAIGRRMIIFSKKYIEENYKDVVVTLDLACSGVFDPKTKVVNPSKYTGKVVHVKDSYCVYGDTDSVFIKFGIYDPETGDKITGLDAVGYAIALCKKAVKEISSQLKRPQNIEFEKSIYPFVLISKKRYHGRYRTKIEKTEAFYDNSMGIALKRRDNAPIVKHVFGGGVNIIMNEQNIEKAREFVFDECQKILKGEFPLDEFIISKTLRSFYKKPRQIAHNVLACRQAQRDPGNRFGSNDRVPYAFIVNSNKSALQGDKIETPDFIQQNKLQLDYRMYITNQIMKPVSQIFELVPGFEDTTEMFESMMKIYEAQRTGNQSMDQFLKPREKPARESLNLYEEIQKRRVEFLKRQQVEEVTDSDTEDLDGDDVVEGVSNYDDPNF